MTRAFVRSVTAWHMAMMAALPAALMPEVDLEEAAFTRAGAAAWEAFIAKVERNCTAMLAEVEEEDRGQETKRLNNGRALVSWVGIARKHARQHLSSFVGQSG